MSIKDRVQDAIKTAMKNKDNFRLECLRMVKGALLLKEKESADAVSEETSIATLRAEVRKRQQSLELFQQLGKTDEAAGAQKEIEIIEEFLPQQLTAEQLEARVREYLAAHPDMNHAGKLTGALKKELGDLADGKLLSESCKKVLGV